MRKRKGLNEGGTYRTLQSLIIPTILYPMKYANGNNDIIEKLEKQINQLLKEKCRVPNGVKYEYMYVHKDLGGLGIDTLENTIGYEKLKNINERAEWKGNIWKTNGGSGGKAATLYTVKSKPTRSGHKPCSRQK
jgi:hypothetical protein